MRERYRDNYSIRDEEEDRDINIFVKLAILCRLNKPQGIFLLVLPAFWSLALNTKYLFFNSVIDVLYYYFAFLVGAILMRSSGCIINDIFDRNIDKLVERTNRRYIATGEISPFFAFLVAVLLALVALGILATFNKFAIVIGALSLILVVIYPLTKRYVYYPQIFLGITFSWGVLLAAVAISQNINLPTILMYVASIFWVIGYDSIYAIQDYRDDINNNIKSLVVLLGKGTYKAVTYLYIFTLILLGIIGLLMHASFIYYGILLLVTLHFIWQIVNIDIREPKLAGKVFSSNVYVGILIFLAFLFI